MRAHESSTDVAQREKDEKFGKKEEKLTTVAVRAMRCARGERANRWNSFGLSGLFFLVDSARSTFDGRSHPAPSTAANIEMGGVRIEKYRYPPPSMCPLLSIRTACREADRWRMTRDTLAAIAPTLYLYIEVARTTKCETVAATGD